MSGRAAGTGRPGGLRLALLALACDPHHTALLGPCCILAQSHAIQTLTEVGGNAIVPPFASLA